MSSKWKIWELLKNYPQVIRPQYRGIVAIATSDAFIERLLIKKLPRAELGMPLSFYRPDELSISMVEQELSGMDLFQSPRSFYVTSSQELSKEVQKGLLDLAPSIDDRLVALFFSRENDFFQKLFRKEGVETISVTAPHFRDNARYLQFLADEMRVQLDPQVFDYLLKAYNLDTAQYIEALNIIRLHSSSAGKVLTAEQVKSLLVSQDIDIFYMTRIYCEKKFTLFYQELLKFADDFNTLRMLFSFLSGHLLKLKDPSFLYSKNYLNAWDKAIISSSKLWQPHELDREIEQMNRLEVLAKSQDIWLKSRLTDSYYHSR